ncbi:hypothetical protein BGW38_008980 [Lunasporangiospora selenospora]|uniref:Uncharacterized protein n=1 Tax=Lunasporangiospora selenospora TaxID=979761 RepID=A0A9P6G3G9_9FUNG|nr:hypothetical protein BGW38_008980 [Lunasporangiospora selenospora]
MLVNPAQSHFKFGRFEETSDSLAPLPKTTRRGAGKHRRTVSCLAVASHHEHYDHPSYLVPSNRYDMLVIAEGSASPVQQSRHAHRKSEGAISLNQLQQSLSNAGAAESTGSNDASNADFAVVSLSSGPLSGKLVKVNVGSPIGAPRRSLLSDLLNNQASPSRMEQNANRRRMLKSMRRYSVDASEVNFSLAHPSSKVTPMKAISSEGETAPMLIGRQEFSSTPTVRYLRNPCHTAIKTKLLPSAYRGSPAARQGADGEDETPDYFGAEERVW